MTHLMAGAGGWSLAVFILGCLGQIKEPHIPMLIGLGVLIVACFAQMRKEAREG